MFNHSPPEEVQWGYYPWALEEIHGTPGGPRVSRAGVGRQCSRMGAHNFIIVSVVECFGVPG